MCLLLCINLVLKQSYEHYVCLFVGFSTINYYFCIVIFYITTNKVITMGVLTVLTIKYQLSTDYFCSIIYSL